jgi:hypothetical protein
MVTTTIPPVPASAPANDWRDRLMAAGVAAGFGFLTFLAVIGVSNLLTG